MNRRLALPFAIVWLVAGCGAGAPDPIVDVPSDDSQASVQRGTATREQPVVHGEAPKEKPSGWRMLGPNTPMQPVQNPALVFGSPCEAGKTEITDFGDPCGKAGRVALEYDGQHSLMSPDAPCSLVRVSPGGKPGEAPNLGSIAVAACVAGDDLVVTGNCEMCRVPNVGWSFHGSISQMPAQAAKTVFAKLGLQGDVPSSTKEWVSALDKVKPPASAQ